VTVLVLSPILLPGPHDLFQSILNDNRDIFDQCLREKAMAQGNENVDGERRFDQWQYEFLKRCSDKGPEGIREWNKWRRDNPQEDIRLEGADLTLLNLNGSHLNSRALRDGKTGQMIRWNSRVYLGGAYLGQATLDVAELGYAQLDGATLRRASLCGAKLQQTSLKGANLWGANLANADLRNANLDSAVLRGANLQGARLWQTRLRGAQCRMVIVDGITLMRRCLIDENTDFDGVGLSMVRIEPTTRQLLEYNVRRRNWEAWYEKHKKLKWLVKPFWALSNYGLSTQRIGFSFFTFAIGFALFYWCWPQLLDGIRTGHDLRSFVHAFYFSVVTMTTLGFGDIAANPDSWQGQALLMVQVILGYVLLGALVTRFAVLFTAGGPAGRFAKATSKREDHGTRLDADGG
ncbi:MAG: pentapeptide repeat-containing protein, partial [Sedimentisphaerales bacterium]|nr:pentapeptide repeat-containing protein [Sedimentisphaerales bacterium]